MSDEHHGPEDNWPQNETEKRCAPHTTPSATAAVDVLPAAVAHLRPLSVLSLSAVLRRLWGYGAATLAIFLYFSYKISGPSAPKQQTTTTTTTVATK